MSFGFLRLKDRRRIKRGIVVLTVLLVQLAACLLGGGLPAHPASRGTDC